MYFIRLKDGSLAQLGGGRDGTGTMVFQTEADAQAVADFWTSPKTKDSKVGIAMYGGKDHTGGGVEHHTGFPAKWSVGLGLIGRIRRDQRDVEYHHALFRTYRESGQPVPAWAYRMGFASIYEGEPVEFQEDK